LLRIARLKVRSRPIRAPGRRTSPLAVNPLRQYMFWPTLSRSAVSAHPPGLLRVAPMKRRSPPMWAPTRRTSPWAVNPSSSSRLPRVTSCAAWRVGS
jgi:hypothetical protein